MLISIWGHLSRMFKDKKLIGGIFLAPLVVLLIIYMISNPQNAIQPIRVGIVDLDASETSSAFIQALQASESFVLVESSKAAAVEALKRNQISAYALIPAGFSQAFYKGDTAAYQVVAKAQSNLRPLQDWLTSGSMALLDPQLKSWQLDIHKEVAPSQYPLKLLLNFMVNFFMFSMIYIVQELYDLKHWKILSRISCAPKSNLQFLAEIWLSMLGILLLQISCINLVSKKLFKAYLIPIHWHSFILVALFAILILAIGLSLSKLIKNSSLIALWINLIVLPTGMISGTFLPADMMPEALTRLGLIAPQFWFSKGIIDIYQQSPIYGPYPFIVLGLMAVLFLIIGSHKYASFAFR